MLPTKNFKEWMNLQQEAKADPSKFSNKSQSLKLDDTGNIVGLTDEDYIKRINYFEINPKAGILTLQKMSPQAPQFRKIVNALKKKYQDIDRWEVQIYGQAGHMMNGKPDQRNRTVGFWLGQTSVDINNKLPKHFYHGTCTNLWYDGIKKNGLLPRKVSGSSGSYGSQNVDSLSRDSMVYLSTHPDAAAREAAVQSSKKHGGKPLILRVDSSGLFQNRFHPDEDTRKDTGQQSIESMSVAAYEGRIPASILEPFLLGYKPEKSKYANSWEWKKFMDVPVEEHPLSKRLRDNDLPYSGDPEYYALKDAGVLDREETYDDRGFRNSRDIKKRDVSDSELKTILKNSPWTQNVRLIMRDLDSGYRGTLFQLKGLKIPSNLTPREQSMINLLQSSKILSIGNGYYDIDSWNPESKVIALAKNLGKSSFANLASQISAFSKNHSEN